jgi:hypothetical protein
MTTNENEIQLDPAGLVQAKKLDAQLDSVAPEDNPELFPGRDEKAEIQDSYTPKFPKVSHVND